jgi:hypothetical protein
MVRRRVTAGATAIALATAIAVAAPETTFAEQRGGDQKGAKPPAPPKRTKQEEAEILQLAKMLDGAMAGQPAAGDIKMTLSPYFLKSQEQRTFVPFTLQLANHPKTDAAMLVRVVQSGGATAAAPPATQGKEQNQKPQRVEYPWEDIHFLPAAELSGDAVRLSRVFMVTPGVYDVYVALKERLSEKAPRDAVAKAGWSKTQVTVPDFHTGELTTSSVILTDKANTLTAAPSPDETRTRPFVFGTLEVVPAEDTQFLKSENLLVFFQVYNPSPDPAGKPNVLIEYNFHRKEGGAEKFFNKTAPQKVEASMLPPTFDLAKFPIPGTIEVPLTSFPEGDYRLEIKVTDNVSKKVVTRDVNFTVKAS